MKGRRDRSPNCGIRDNFLRLENQATEYCQTMPVKRKNKPGREQRGIPSSFPHGLESRTLFVTFRKDLDARFRGYDARRKRRGIYLDDSKRGLSE